MAIDSCLKNIYFMNWVTETQVLLELVSSFVLYSTFLAFQTLLNRPGNYTKPLMYTFLIPWLGEENVLTG